MPFLGANTLIINYYMKLFSKNGNRTHGSRCYLLLLQNHAPGLTLTWAAPGCIYRLTLTASCILVDSLWLVPINVTPCHMMTTPQMTVKLKRSKGRRKNITVLTRVSLVHKHQWTTVITTVWSESTWGLPESSATNDSESECSSNDGWHKTKVLSPRWVSAPKSYIWPVNNCLHEGVVRTFVGRS